MNARIEVVGQRHGRLVIENEAEPYYLASYDRYDRRVNCICDCGNRVTVKLSSIRKPTGTKSCGCLRKVSAARKSENWRWRDKPSYGTVHSRLKRYRGRARDQQCQADGCERRATNWAYLHNAEEELAEVVVDTRSKDPRSRLVRFSADLDSYAPMCHLHHVELDKAVAKVRYEQQIQEAIQAAYELGRTVGRIER